MTTADKPLSSEELMLKIRSLRRKLGKDRPDKPMPGAGEELWPGGPSVDTNDIRLASRRRIRRQAVGGTA